MVYKKRHTLLLFIIIAATALVLMVHFRWKGNSGADWKYTVEGDGKGYYAYLDQIFIKHNFGSAPVDYNQINEVDSQSVIKFCCGPALLLSPFFLASLLTCKVFGLPVDAYTEVFQKPVSIAAIFYLMLGLWFLYRLLKQFQIKQVYASLALAIVFFATNLLNYVLVEPAMSHVYSFSMISGFLWAAGSFIGTKKWKFLFLCAVLLGVIYLIRPVNMIVVFFLLFFFPDLGSAWVFLKGNLKRMIAAACITLLVMSIQHFLYYAQCGKFFVWPYQGEGFYFLHPEIVNVLFSFKKGLFIYTPVTAIFLAGLFFVFRENRYKFVIGLLFILGTVYLLSSWWCWSYFDGFGMRPMVDFYTVFALFFTFLLQKLVKWMRMAVLILCALFLSLNLVQTYQYKSGIIHPEYMNFKSYKYVFLRTSADYSNCIGGVYDLVPYDKFKKELLVQSAVKANTNTNTIGENQFTLIFDERTEYNSGISIESVPAISRTKKLYAEINFSKYDFGLNSSSEALLVATIDYPGQMNQFYYTCKLNYLPGGIPQQWQEINFSLILPRVVRPDFKMNFYIWNKGFQHFLIRDFGVRVLKTF